MASRKDYLMVANCINKALIDGDINAPETLFLINNLVECLSYAYQKDNPKFAYDKFKNEVYKNLTDQEGWGTTWQLTSNIN
jgi:hypothetical protein